MSLYMDDASPGVWKCRCHGIRWKGEHAFVDASEAHSPSWRVQRPYEEPVPMEQRAVRVVLKAWGGKESTIVTFPKAEAPSSDEQPEPTEDNVFKRLLREHPEGGGDPIRIERLKHFRLHVDTMSDDEVRQAASNLTGYPVPTPRERAEEKVRLLLDEDAPTKALLFTMLRAEGMDSDRAKMILRDAKWNLP